MIPGSKISRLLLAGACAVLLLATLSFAHPFGNPRQASAASRRLLEGAQIWEQVRGVVERTYDNCHSNAGT